MKIYKKIALTLSVIIASSCTLDLREDPNAVQPDQVLPSLLLNTMQTNLAGMFNGASGTGMAMVRLQNAGSSIYATSNTPEGFNGIWSTAYAGILQDADVLIAAADENGYARHAGMARIIQAYTLVTLVDFFGDVPFSEAFQGSANFNPALDDAAGLYDFALDQLDQAKLDLSTPLTTSNPAGYLNPVAPAITDLYYANNYTKWIKLANTLKLKIWLNLRLTQAATATTEINALIADVTPTGGLITAANENFIFRYGTNTSDPDSRHPSFVGQYPAGGGAYQSNWLMWHMFHGYDATQNGTAGDPRMRFYFYRQTTANSTSTNEIRCLTESVPAHYPSSTGAAIDDPPKGGRAPLGTNAGNATVDPADPAWNRTFCYPTNVGYWGRDHVDPQGIPPDNLLRTAWGAYPVGGRFDNNAGAGVAASQGMRGAGFQPIMMRSYVQFMLAEAALFLGVTSPAPAGLCTTGDCMYYRAGMDYSFNDVRTWATTGTYGTTSAAAAPNEAATINGFYSSGTYTTDFANYMNAATNSFNTQLLINDVEAMNYIAREYWIASFGNGVEAYNLYRRTGQPTGMQPVINPQPGFFPKSFWYPANAANLNNQIDQKADMSGQVFWDNNSFDLDF
jgi:hypothetical protein